MAARPTPRVMGAVVAAIAIAAVAWFVWFRSDERQIRRQLTRLAEEINEPSDGIGAVAKAASIGAAFADEVVIDLGEGAPIRGRDTVMGIAARVQPRASRYEVTIRDMNVRVGDGPSAAVDLSLTTTSESGMDAREFQIGMVKRDGKWLIARVTPVKVLEK